MYKNYYVEYVPFRQFLNQFPMIVIQLKSQFHSSHHTPMTHRCQIGFTVWPSMFVSMDWFKGKSTGNHGFYHQI